MSVQVNQYLGYGFFMPYKQAIEAMENKYDENAIEDIFNKYHDSAFKSEIVAINDCSMIVDGMSAEFIFFGFVAQKSKNDEYLNSMVMEKPKAKIVKNVEAGMLEMFGSNFGMKPNFVLITLYR